MVNSGAWLGNVLVMPKAMKIFLVDGPSELGLTADIKCDEKCTLVDGQLTVPRAYLRTGIIPSKAIDELELNEEILVPLPQQHFKPSRECWSNSYVRQFLTAAKQLS